MRRRREDKRRRREGERGGREEGHIESFVYNSLYFLKPVAYQVRCVQR